MMKMIVHMDVYDEKSKRKISKKVDDLPGIHNHLMDLKEGTLTVFGYVDPVKIVTKLRKKWRKAKLTLFVPYDPTIEAKITEVKQKNEAIEREARFRSNCEIRNLYVSTTHSNIVNDQEQGCVIC